MERAAAAAAGSFCDESVARVGLAAAPHRRGRPGMSERQKAKGQICASVCVSSVPLFSRSPSLACLFGCTAAISPALPVYLVDCCIIARLSQDSCSFCATISAQSERDRPSPASQRKPKHKQVHLICIIVSMPKCKHNHPLTSTVGGSLGVRSCR